MYIDFRYKDSGIILQVKGKWYEVVYIDVLMPMSDVSFHNIDALLQ